jgi:TetR/AcrR family transcriptional regulator, lmrAB and yxaGH operons repressor
VVKIQLERSDAVPMIAEVFREHGYAGTSLSIITTRTGIGKGSLYHFFPGGKAEMAEAVLAHISGWFEDRIFTPLAAASEPIAGIHAMFDGVDQYFQSGNRVCLVGLMALDASRDEFSARIFGYFSRWQMVLKSALVRAGLFEADANQRSNDILAGIQGGLVLARALNAPEIFAATIATLRSSLPAVVAQS